jgi:uncharacterized protein YheU (UPF0270 family)
MLQIPPDRLAPDVLDALIEEFVTRHGTDLTDAPAKVAQVRAQLRAGHVVIVYDDLTETANIVPKDAKPAAAPAEKRVAPTVVYDEAPTTAYGDDGPRIVYDEPAPPDPTE